LFRALPAVEGRILEIDKKKVHGIGTPLQRISQNKYSIVILITSGFV